MGYPKVPLHPLSGRDSGTAGRTIVGSSTRAVTVNLAPTLNTVTQANPTGTILSDWRCAYLRVPAYSTRLY